MVEAIKATITQQESVQVTNFRVFSGSTVRFGDLFDVNVSSAIDGSLLVYNGPAQIWEATNQLDPDKLSIEELDGGTY